MIGPAVLADLDDMVAIYNQSIADAVYANLDSAQRDSAKFRRLYFSRAGRHAVLVSKWNGEMIGWGALKSFSALPGEPDIAEVAVYVARPFRSRGTGIYLLNALAKAAEQAGFHSLVAIVLGHNKASLRGAAACGFTAQVNLRSVARIYDASEDVVWMQRILKKQPEGITG